MSAIIIENAVIITDPLEGVFKYGESIAVEEEEIRAIGSARQLWEAYPDADLIEGEGCFLLPGLIDAHTHLYGSLIDAKPPVKDPPQNFPQILDRVWWQWDKSLTSEDIAVSALVGCIASLRSGITTIFDHHASPGATIHSLDVLAENIGKCGLRSCLAYEISDRNGSDSFEEGVEENRRFILDTKQHENDMLKGLFGMHAVFSLSDVSLQRCAEEMRLLNVGCHLHVAEHGTELQKFAETHDCSIPEYLVKIGILGPNSLLAHTVHLEDVGIRIIKSAGAFNVHNPRSNMVNGVGIARVKEMFELGLAVCLGSDGFFDLPYEAVYAKLLQIMATGNPSAFSDRQALIMLYDHNVRLAERTFNCRLGKIKTGYKADLILTVYSPIAPIEEQNRFSHIISALTNGHIKTILINGKPVMKDFTITGVDVDQVYIHAREVAKRIWDRFR